MRSYNLYEGGRALGIDFGIIILAILLLAAGASGVGAAAGTNINSCTTISSPGEYVLTTSINNATTCINITSSDVTLDGAGYTINGRGTGGSGVFVSNSSITLTNVTVKNLKVTNWSDGIFYINVQNGSIANNTANSNHATIRGSNSYQGTGISLSSSSNNTLTKNTASNNARIGIDIVYSGSNTLTNNTANSNINGYGIAIRLTDSSNNTLINNTVTNSTNYGIFIISSSNNNTLTSNTVNKNNIGIYLSDSNNNTIYNNILNNTNNTYTDAPNIWNTTKKAGINIIGGSHLGGNFWGNPSGTGFSQTCLDNNKDGLCDVQYTLADNNSDYLPLTVPAASPIPTAGSISGFKVNDTNGNGKWDAGEKGISNWTIRLICIIGKGKNATVIRNETFTDATGFYKFNNLSAGRYFVIEKLKKGFVPTSSPVKRIKLAQGKNSMNNNFTNRPIQSRDKKDDNRDIDDYEAINRDIDKHKEDTNWN
jgi:parallel beta-helix repeat protein